MDKDCIEYSTTCRGNRRIFTRRTIASALDRWQGTGKVLDGNGVATKWYRERKQKETGGWQGEDKRKIGYSQVNNSVILRISYVYVTYMVRN